MFAQKNTISNKWLAFIFIVLAFIFLSHSLSFAAIPQTISYQGKLISSAGVPLTGDYDMTFKIYDVSSGGTALWTESQTGVSVASGRFSVILGSTTPIPYSVFNGANRWLGIAVESDNEMTPRMRIASVPYAYYAATAESLSGGSNFISRSGDRMTGTLSFESGASILITGEDTGYPTSLWVIDDRIDITNNNFGNILSLGFHPSDGSAIYTSTGQSIILGDDMLIKNTAGPLSFQDNILSSPIMITQMGATGLSGFSSGTSIVGGLNELQSDKFEKSGDIMTGALTIEPTSGELSLKVIGKTELGDASCLATGSSSVAMGNNNTASGYASVALGGESNTASGTGAVAMGASNTAGGNNSVVMGQSMTVNGTNSIGINLDSSTRTLSQNNAAAIMGGNVGVGKINPSAKLHVVGSVEIEGSHFSIIPETNVVKAFEISSWTVNSSGGSPQYGIYGTIPSSAAGKSVYGEYLTGGGKTAALIFNPPGGSHYSGQFVNGAATANLGYYNISNDTTYSGYFTSGNVYINDNLIIYGTIEAGSPSLPGGAVKMIGGLHVLTGIITGDGSGLTNLPSSSDNTKVLKTGDTMTGTLTIEGDHLVINPEANVPKALEIKSWTNNTAPPTPQYGLYVDGPAGSTAQVTSGYLESGGYSAEFAHSTPVDGYAGYFSDGTRKVYLAQYDDNTADSWAGHFTGNLKVIGSAEIGAAGCKASGQNSFAIGTGTTASGPWSFAAGMSNTSSGSYSFALGETLTAGGSNSIVMGSTFNVTGTNSIGFKLNTDGPPPTLSRNNTFAVIGGNVGIGTTEPTAALQVNGNLRVTGTIEGSSPVKISGGITLTGVGTQSITAPADICIGKCN